MPKTTVAGIVVSNKKDKVLLTQRNIPPFEGQWCLPGGHIDDKEEARDAVIREIQEETGLSNFEATFFGYFDEIIPENNIHATVLTFVGTADGTLKAQASEVSNLKWFALNEACSLPLAFTHNEILNAYYKARGDLMVAEIEPNDDSGQQIVITQDMRTEMLAEYSALRSELLKRIGMRQHILTFALVISGTLLTFGLQFPWILLVYPILALFLALAWVQHDTRIGEISEYLRLNIDNLLEGIRWETYIRKQHQNRSVRLVQIYAIGLFFGMSILNVFIAFPQLDFSISEISLLIIDFIVIILMLVILQRRKTMLYK